MLRVLLLMIACALFSSASVSNAAVIQQTFHVGNLTVSRLCQNRVITAVNGQFPGPLLDVHDGDTLVITVVNISPYNISIHWHGIFQRLTAWADGPSYVTQCPIMPGNKYTYRFNITGQEGTLWWHAHFSVLRATVYGPLIIRPKPGNLYPFPKPHKEATLMLGEWWNSNVVELEQDALERGGAPNTSDAYTINGQPGDLYPCSSNGTYKLKVEQGKTYLLRIINAALDNQLFFKIAGHRFKVVAVDASYTTPYSSDVIVIAPGQTVDALMVADAAPGRYYMAARAYVSAIGVPADTTTTTGIVEYAKAPRIGTPIMPLLPGLDDTQTAHRFYTNLTSLLLPGVPRVPLKINKKMFITFGIGFAPCRGNQPRCNISNGAIAADMNNVSFAFPDKLSLLEAHFGGVPGIYTRDFPNKPPLVFDYTDPSLSFNRSLIFTSKATKVKRLRYNATVEIVLQNTALVAAENHPLHLHGFNFFVVAQGFGNYDVKTARKSFNLVNPQIRNTIGVPTGGWAVIRFVADNPGVWFFHCHFDVHLPWGLAMAFEVDNGPTPDTTLPPPPSDLPKC